MLFMVYLECQFVSTVSAEEIASVRKAETERAIELMGSGNLLRIWRVPATISSFAVWSFDTPEELDAAVKSLPAFPYFTKIEITPLIQHPSLKAYGDRTGKLPVI